MIIRLVKTETLDLERLQVVTFEDKLTQRPLLQVVLVCEALDSEALEALLLINGVTEFFEHRVHNLRRCAAEPVNVDIGSRLKVVVLIAPLIDGVRRVVSPAFVCLHAIDLYFRLCDVLGAFVDDLGLVGHG